MFTTCRPQACAGKMKPNDQQLQITLNCLSYSIKQRREFYKTTFDFGIKQTLTTDSSLSRVGAIAKQADPVVISHKDVTAV